MMGCVTDNIATNYPVSDGVTDNLEQRVIGIIAKKKKLDPSTIRAASTFEQLGLDSLDAADMLFAFEDEFKIIVPDEAAQSMRTVGQVVEALRAVLDKGASV
jgi:acyl carrier protein